jgi:hypothetical protein
LVLTKTDETKPAELATIQAQTAAEARKHTPALAEIFATSALKRTGLDGLQEHLAGLAVR